MTAEHAIPAPVAGAGEIEPADLARYAAAAAAATDPEQLLEAATAAFGELLKLVQAGDRRAADGASLAVQDHCLALCASEAASARASDDKVRFLAIMLGWAWPRVPAVGAVLEAAIVAEVARWGQAVEGLG